MIRSILLLIFLIPGLLSVAQSKVKPVYGSFTDFRDKKTYKTITLGNQTWFGYNLNYATPNSWCYLDSSDYCKTYGRLYTQDAAKSACPAGWHLPSSEEWMQLINRIGGNAIAGRYLKQTGTEHWKSPNNSDNSSGFNAVPAGFRDAHSEACYKIGEEAVFWSSSKTNNSELYGWSFFLNYNSDRAFTENITLSNYKNGYSVRCLKNVLAPTK